MRGGRKKCGGLWEADFPIMHKFAHMNPFRPVSVRWNRLTLGGKLLIIVALKLAVMFLLLRPFLFRPALAGLSEGQKAETVGRSLAE